MVLACSRNEKKLFSEPHILYTFQDCCLPTSVTLRTNIKTVIATIPSPDSSCTPKYPPVARSRAPAIGGPANEPKALVVHSMPSQVPCKLRSGTRLEITVGGSDTSPPEANPYASAKATLPAASCTASQLRATAAMETETPRRTLMGPKWPASHAGKTLPRIEPALRIATK